ncbi:VWA domain-containing protein [Alishewanella sp. 16-MA]|uniref:VWA domain-containing protein n=1 Tax=Alishewanella maricola TaxID=2795740 RepID=A0ABS8C1U0_9ALTE|nr:VWA domain-containing protein [Alishewanella maricola]MCB5225980.1 VWA domain-containing protein [Alishewanella maricola]MDP5036504.1 VWA domain-containing protein [Alishewanella sp.]
MLIEFFFTLRKYGLKVSITELLDLLNALEQQVIFADSEAFYQLARLIMVKDESQYDKFDRAFAEYFEGVAAVDLASSIPDEWLIPDIIRQLSAQDKAALKGLGSLEALMAQLRERLAEQQKRHAGGNKWIGTGGTSPFGAYGFNPEGVRIGQQGSGARRAVKVWDKREFKDLDSHSELNNRSIKLALRQLRRFARSGAATELDLNGTIQATSEQGGYLDLRFVPERHNAIKVLMFFDVGGSMDDHITLCQQLFSAVKTEFKHLEFFYFHNCVYEGVWRDNSRRFTEQTSVLDVIHTYGSDYKLIFVGDATMGPYEIDFPGGSVEHWNAEPGRVWLNRLLQQYPKAAWLNPQPLAWWGHYHSISLVQSIMQQRMFPLTLTGLSDAIKSLS